MMHTVSVHVQSATSLIHVGERLANVNTHLPDRPLFIVTDPHIQALYGHAFPKAPVITIGTGEKIKTLATVENLLIQLMHFGCDRDSFILGIGGGIVCDITGFAASIFLRGVPFGFVSTSLLSQVDASLGGKNGVNLHAFKNMAGLFSQPRFVICDPELLTTLPDTEIANGMAEIVKHALIADPDMLAYIETHHGRAAAKDMDVLTHLISRSVEIKSGIVQQDETESGHRRILNFGHTIGHALERQAATGHGRAVARGMAAAARMSMERGGITAEDVQRIVCLLKDLHLPTDLPHTADQIMDGVRGDKKKAGASLFFVFLSALGTAKVERISFVNLERLIRSLYL